MQNNLTVFITIEDDLKKYSYIYFNCLYWNFQREKKSLFILRKRIFYHIICAKQKHLSSTYEGLLVSKSFFPHEIFIWLDSLRPSKIRKGKKNTLKVPFSY